MKTKVEIGVLLKNKNKKDHDVKMDMCLLEFPKVNHFAAVFLSIAHCRRISHKCID